MDPPPFSLPSVVIYNGDLGVHDGVDRVALITAELMIRGLRYYARVCII